MNRAPTKPAAAAKRPKPKENSNPNPQIRSPLKDLNARGAFTSRTEQPTSGCFRPRFSNSTSSSSSSSTNPTNCRSRNPKNPPGTTKLKSLKQLDKGREIGDRSCGQTVSRKKVISAGRDDFLSRSGRLEKAAGGSGKGYEFTPPVGCKTASLEFGIDKGLSSNCDENGNGNTPPAEATVSPEIQCGSTVMSAATPVCFGAVHVLSGVSDKRKCRPRGVLVVGDEFKGIVGLSISNEGLDGIGEAGGLDQLLPVEASMHWLLSPCDEDVDRNGESGILTSSVDMRSSLSGSPWKTPDGTGGVSCFDEMIYSNLAGHDSSCSKDTLGSENVIQTPESYSSLERHMSLPWFHADSVKHAVESNLECAADGKYVTSSSSEGEIVAFKQIDSSFEFDCHLKPATATSIELSRLQDNWDKSLWISDAIAEKSQFRISWRDGVSSHHTEIDNLDCCRCLSDEEDKNHQNSLYPASSEIKLPEINTLSFTQKSDIKSDGFMNRNENSTLQKDIQCAESISLDGGSLVASGDSGWDMCYKSNLF